MAHSVFEAGLNKFMHEPGYILEYVLFSPLTVDAAVVGTSKRSELWNKLMCSVICR